MKAPTEWPVETGQPKPVCVKCDTMQPPRQRVAFMAVVHQGTFIIGRADEGEQGYCPLPGFGLFDDYDAAHDRAELLNQAIGMDTKTAAEIVARTMLQGNMEGRLKTLADLLRRALTNLKNDDFEVDELIGDIEEALED